MKLSNLVYAGAGYVLGTRAGHDRYEQIVRLSRRVAGSQTVQSTAGVVQAQVDVLTAQARHLVATKLSSGRRQQGFGSSVHVNSSSGVNETTHANGTNGYRN